MMTLIHKPFLSNPKSFSFFLITLILLFNTQLFAQEAEVQLFKSDKDKWNRLFIELKKINIRVQDLATDKIKPIKKTQANLQLQLDEIKSLIPSLQGAIEKNGSNVNDKFRKVDQIVVDLENKVVFELQENNKIQKSIIDVILKGMGEEIKAHGNLVQKRQNSQANLENPESKSEADQKLASKKLDEFESKNNKSVSNKILRIENMIHQAQLREKEIYAVFSKLQELDKLDNFLISPEEKITEWIKFLKSYPSKNAYLKKANDRIKYWKNFKAGNTPKRLVNAYINEIKKKVLGNWNLENEISEKITASFSIMSNGKINSPRILNPSVKKFVNDSIKQAILNSQPFPVFPEGLDENSLIISIGFENKDSSLRKNEASTSFDFPQ